LCRSASFVSFGKRCAVGPRPNTARLRGGHSLISISVQRSRGRILVAPPEDQLQHCCNRPLTFIFLTLGTNRRFDGSQSGNEKY
jgi:hypothetical protein